MINIATLKPRSTNLLHFRRRNFLLSYEIMYRETKLKGFAARRYVTKIIDVEPSVFVYVQVSENFDGLNLTLIKS